MVKRCLYMCTAVLLVLSSVFYLVTPPVFASQDSVPFFQIYLSYSDTNEFSGGKWYGLNDFLTDTAASGHKNWKIEAFRFFLGNTYPSELTLSFVIGCAYRILDATNPNLNHDDIPINSWQNWNGQKGGTVYTSYPNGNTSNNAYWYCYCVSAGMISSSDFDNSVNNRYVIGQNLKQINIRFRPNLASDTNTQSVFVLSTPIVFSVNQTNISTYDNPIPFVTNVTLIQNYSPILNSIFTELQSHHAALMSKLTTYFADTQNIYTWNEIHNTDDGSEMITQTGNWWSAMLGQLRSLNNDAQTQWEEQEKARNAGAMDALDQGFDSADSHDVFGSSIDMFGLGEMGSYNDDTVSEWGGDGFITWFSARTRDDLDQVPLTRRNPDDNFISFYSDHIDEILSMLGVEDQRGDNPTYYRGD